MECKLQKLSRYNLNINVITDKHSPYYLSLNIDYNPTANFLEVNMMRESSLKKMPTT